MYITLELKLVAEELVANRFGRLFNTVFANSMY